MAEQRASSAEKDDVAIALKEAEDIDGAFRELHRRFYSRLLAFFARRGFGRESSQDLSQETFVRVFKGIQDFRGGVPLDAWIFQIAANLAKNEIRRRHAGKRLGKEEAWETLAEAALPQLSASSATAEPLNRALAREQVEALSDGIEQLPAQMRRTLRLSVVQGRSVAQIADLMQVSRSTVKVQLHLARKKLRQLLAERFGEVALLSERPVGKGPS